MLRRMRQAMNTLPRGCIDDMCEVTGLGRSMLVAFRDGRSLAPSVENLDMMLLYLAPGYTFRIVKGERTYPACPTLDEIKQGVPSPQMGVAMGANGEPVQQVILNPGQASK